MWLWLSGKKSFVSEVPELAEALPRIGAEFERARRYERTVTVAVLTEETPPGTAANTAAAVPRNGSGARHNLQSSLTTLGTAVRQGVREIDVVICDPAHRCCIVVMPEIGPEEGRRAVSRLRQLCAARLGRAVQGDLAVFPQDGWVFPDLVEAARRQALSRRDGRLAVPLADGAA
jgi:hypothetical protein